MNSKVLETLEYDKIKSQLAAFLVTSSGQQEGRELLPSIDEQEINYWLQETADAVLIDHLKGGIPLSKLADISAHLKRLTMQASLSATEISQVGQVLRNTGTIANFLDRKSVV